MLKIKKVKKEVEVDYKYCDICGRKMCYFEGDIELVYPDEDNYNYGSDGIRHKTYYYDICETCVKKVLFPYIKKITNKKPRIESNEED